MGKMGKQSSKRTFHLILSTSDQSLSDMKRILKILKNCVYKGEGVLFFIFNVTELACVKILKVTTSYFRVELSTHNLEK